MNTGERYQRVIAFFEKERPIANSELNYRNPFELLVAVILSAQCTDKRVNMITPALFEAYPDAESMASASAEDIFEYIKSVSYPNNKSRHLAAMSRSTRRHRSSTTPARRGTQNSQRNSLGNIQQTYYGCRHSCI